jgi:protocatechuate 3,4-dioxygenase beta subunit
MDNDDVMRGRLVGRRELLGLLGAAGVALLVGCSDDEPEAAATAAPTGAAAAATDTTAAAATSGSSAGASGSPSALPACIVIPELTEGPYFVDELLERTDIRTDPESGAVSEGVPLRLTLNVVTVSGAACAPLADAMVDVWHCDALGVYSDVTDTAEGFNTVGQKFLRGFQRTDASGQASFVTIYPGWYPGRATHIHFKVRSDDLEFTSQLFFADALSDQVHANAEPYAEKGAAGRLQNGSDNIYGESDGLLLLDLVEEGDGYAASFAVGVQL